ncbi:MAG: hypothetical protein IPM29_26870 [Planctomycetes bacterium]|nr:hypothetical protein [Planctomycetota bacterium]
MRATSSIPSRVLAVAALAAVLGAQDVERPAPVEPAQLGLELRLEADGERIVGLAPVAAPGEPRGPVEFPFARPVRSVAFGSYGGDVLVVLAGGIGEPLDFYVIGLADRSLGRLATADGRRLPDAFAGGLGSLPMRAAGTLYLLAWETENRVQFRVWMPGRASGSRALPLSCVGYEAQWNADRRRVAVRFLDADGRELDRLDAPHPDQPRLVFDASRDPRSGEVAEGAIQGSLAFGVVELGAESTRILRLRNVGRAALRQGSVRVEGADFELRAPAPGGPGLPFDLDPQAAVEVEVAFRPRSSEPARGRIVVEGSPESGLVLELTGAVRDEPTRPPVVAVAPPPDAVARAAQPVVAVERPPTPVPVAAPDLTEVEVGWTPAGHVRVAGRVTGPLRPSLDGPLSLLLTDRDSGAAVLVPVQPGGRFEATLPARALDELAAAWTAGGLATALPPAPLSLLRQGDDLAVRAPAQSTFLLIVGLPAVGERPFVPLEVREGRSGPRGEAVLPGQVRRAARLGAGALRLVVMDRRGELRVAELRLPSITGPDVDDR